MQTNNENIMLLAVAVVLGVAIIVLLVAVYALSTMAALLRKREQAEQENGTETFTLKQPKLSLWAQFDRKYLTNAVPLDKESDVMLHHNYDGIKELDNHLPPWWVGIFYISIGFAVVYMLMFHVWRSAPLSADEYTMAMEKAEIQIAEYKAKAAESIDETNVTFLTDAIVLDHGKTLFVDNCQACHGAELQGGVGPNLVDEFWLHGGSVNDVFKIIKQGVPEKGMIAWKSKLKPADIQAVSSYILSLQGTKPANAKAPQGEKYDINIKQAQVKIQADIPLAQ